MPFASRDPSGGRPSEQEPPRADPNDDGPPGRVRRAAAARRAAPPTSAERAPYRAVVLLLNPDGVSLRQAAVDGVLLPIDVVDRPRGQGLWDRVLNSRQPVVVQDVQMTPGVWRTLTDPAGIRSFVHVPIQLEDT